MCYMHDSKRFVFNISVRAYICSGIQICLSSTFMFFVPFNVSLAGLCPPKLYSIVFYKLLNVYV